MPTPPAPAPGAEVLSFSIMDAVIDDGNGQVKIEVDTFSADKNLPNDVTITDDGTESITLIAISKIGGGDGEQDVFRFDLSTFDDDFQITIADQGPEDIFYFEGVHAFVDNGDGTSTITYYGSDAALHTVTVDPDTAQIGIYYAPDGVVDGANGGEVMDVGYLDFQGDEIDGVDGVNDTIFGNAGSDTITGGAGNDTIFGDFDIETAGKPTPDLPANAFVGTPAGPATGAEVDTVTLDDVLIDNNGAATITIEDFADPDNENDVTINDGGTKDLVDLIIEKGGNTDEPDVFRLDLSGFNDDFAIELKNVDTTDKIVLTNVFTIEDNGDDTSTITYYGSDSALHTVVLTPDVAQIEAYITDDSPYFFDDTIYGGAGDDVIDGGYGDDTIDAGDDDDTVEGGVGDDNILGGAGADTIDGGDGSDTIDGGTGDDVIVGDRTGQAEGLADTIGYSYAQTITGDEASHFGEQGTGAANDPLNFIDRDLATDARFHVDDFFEYSFGQEVPAGTSITLTEGSGADDEIVNVYVSFGSTDPAGDANSGSGGGVGYQNAITGGQSVLVYSGPSDATVEFDVPMNATHIQFLGVVSHGGWAEIEFTDILNPLAPGDDIITGGDGNDTIDGGYGDDSIDGGADDDTIDGGWGDDSIIGGDGVNTLYGGDGDPDIPLERVAFKWSDIPDPDDGGQIDTGDTLEDGSQTVSGVQIDYTFSANKATFDTTSTATAGVDAGSGSVDPNSSISFDDTVTVDLNFSEAVTNVSFRINDFEGNTESMVIRAYDADGNLIPFSTTLGSNMSGSDADAIPGDDTFSGSGPEEGDTSLNNSMLVEIAGPVARIELEMSSTGGSLSASDIYFDDPNTGTNTAGNDVIDAGDGDDVIIAGLGTDTISGGIGSDTYDAAVSTDLSNDEITVVVDGMGDGTVDKAADGTTDTFSSIESFVADENASENDTITITDAVGASEATNLSDSSVGIFTPDGGGAPIAFGGFGEPTINDILTRSYDPGTGLVEPQGTYQITSGEEDGAEIGNISLENFEEINFSVICFARNTRILTMNGPVCVEDLKAGDRAITMDSGYQKIRWIGSKLVPALAELAPIRFRKGAIGNSRDLLVSPQHRMLVMDGRNELHFGDCEVLVPAKHLVNGTTIQRIEGGFVEYYHFLFDQHEIVFAEGAPAESFHPGSEGWGALSQASRDEITRLFPELKCGNFDSLGMTARRSLKKHEAALVAQY